MKSRVAKVIRKSGHGFGNQTYGDVQFISELTVPSDLPLPGPPQLQSKDMAQNAYFYKFRGPGRQMERNQRHPHTCWMSFHSQTLGFQFARSRKCLDFWWILQLSTHIFPTFQLCPFPDCGHHPVASGTDTCQEEGRQCCKNALLWYSSFKEGQGSGYSTGFSASSEDTFCL